MDAQNESEWLAADEAAMTDDDEHTAIVVPHELLPESRRLLGESKPD